MIEQIGLLCDELVKLELRTFAQLVRRFEDAQDFEFQALPEFPQLGDLFIIRKIEVCLPLFPRTRMPTGKNTFLSDIFD